MLARDIAMKKSQSLLSGELGVLRRSMYKWSDNLKRQMTCCSSQGGDPREGSLQVTSLCGQPCEWISMCFQHYIATTVYFLLIAVRQVLECRRPRPLSLRVLVLPTGCRISPFPFPSIFKDTAMGRLYIGEILTTPPPKISPHAVTLK